MKIFHLDWGDWFYGMWVAIATGASNSAIAGLTLKAMDDAVFNRETGTFMAYVGWLFLIGASKDFLLYINKRPAPNKITETQTTVVATGNTVTAQQTSTTTETTKEGGK